MCGRSREHRAVFPKLAQVPGCGTLPEFPFLLLPSLPVMTPLKPDFHHSPRTQAPLSAKGQQQPGVSHYNLSELDKDLGDLVQPPSCNRVKIQGSEKTSV